mmetsp:Transcript_90897/g.126255  ORF Transcript_90897/g.126255 Transcript_90897/m.126255 type:complete len:92 (-) Transcript_90897:1464-1739(-)
MDWGRARDIPGARLSTTGLSSVTAEGFETTDGFGFDATDGFETDGFVAAGLGLGAFTGDFGLAGGVAGFDFTTFFVVFGDDEPRRRARSFL